MSYKSTLKIFHRKNIKWYFWKYNLTIMHYPRFLQTSVQVHKTRFTCPGDTLKFRISPECRSRCCSSLEWKDLIHTVALDVFNFQILCCPLLIGASSLFILFAFWIPRFLSVYIAWILKWICKPNPTQQQPTSPSFQPACLTYPPVHFT